MVIGGVSKKTWEISEDMMKRDISFIDDFDVEDSYGPEFVEKMKGGIVWSLVQPDRRRSKWGGEECGREDRGWVWVHSSEGPE